MRVSQTKSQNVYVTEKETTNDYTVKKKYEGRVSIIASHIHFF